MLEELAGEEENVAKARKRLRAEVEQLCLPFEELAAIDEASPVRGLREQSYGVIGG